MNRTQEQYRTTGKKAEHLIKGDYWLKRWRFMRCRRKYYSGGCNRTIGCVGCMYDLSLEDFRQICSDIYLR